MKKFVSTVTVLAVMLMAVPFVSYASDNFPNKPINMIIAFSAGGSSDTQARIMQKHWDRFNKSRWIFVYKPGAGGGMGFREISRARPDGYNIGGINVPHILIQPLAQKVPYDYTNFDYICQVVNDPQTITVKKGSDFTTLKAFFDHVKANPGKIRFGMVGPNSGQHLMYLEMIEKFDFKVVPVFYKGAAEQSMALLGGEIEAMIGNLNDVMRSLDEMTVLGVSSEKQNDDFLPGVLTMREQGYDIISDIRRGIVAPKGLNPEVLAKLRDLFRTIANDPEYLADMKKIGQPAEYLDGPDFEAYIASQNAIAKAALLKAGVIQ